MSNPSPTDPTLLPPPPETGPLVRYQIQLRERSEPLEDAIEGALWGCDDIIGFERIDRESQTPEEVERIGAVDGVVWQIHLEHEGDLDELRDAFRARFDEAWPITVTAIPITDHGYLTAYLAYFKPTQISPRIIVHPPWDKPVADGMTLIEIDPGMAFGTGTHETTRLCLRGIDELLLAHPIQSVLDVGTGSGILAIAAARLGATHLIAIDNDPIAVTATRENVERNELAVPIVASTKPLDQFTDTFDLVVANILATVIKRLKVELYRTTAEGGFLLLSGILETERRSVEETFLELGANHLRSETMGDWCSILLQKPAP